MLLDEKQLCEKPFVIAIHLLQIDLRFSPVCVLMCLVNLSFLKNFIGQKVHRCFLSSSVRRCRPKNRGRKAFDKCLTYKHCNSNPVIYLYGAPVHPSTLALCGINCICISGSNEHPDAFWNQLFDWRSLDSQDISWFFHCDLFDVYVNWMMFWSSFRIRSKEKL